MSKITIRTPNHLGDCLMAQPSIRALIAGRPNDDVNLLLPEWAEPIYRDAGASKMLSLDNQHLHGIKAIFLQRKLLKEGRFDIGVLLTPSFSSALAFYLGGVRERYGYNREGRRYFLNHAVDPQPVKSLHRSEKYRYLIEQIIGKADVAQPGISVSNALRQKAADLLNRRGVKSEDQYVAIAPQAIAESRRWGSNNYATLAVRIIEKLGHKVVLLGTAGEYEAGKAIINQAANSVPVGGAAQIHNEIRIANMCGKTDIETAAAMLSTAKLFIGNDSGLAHLAAAVDIPLVVLSGADSPAETSPISRKKIVIIRDQLDCISCVKNTCPKKGEAFMRCMKQISVDEVLEAVRGLVSA